MGRQKFDGSYTSHLGNVPIYSRKSIPENLKAHQRITSDDGSILKSDKDDIAWFRENWDELDLIDPQKFAIFPGDVVLITNKSHSKSNKRGILTLTIQFRGLSKVWCCFKYLHATWICLGQWVEYYASCKNFNAVWSRRLWPRFCF